MGAQYQWLQVVTDWMVQQGVEADTAATFVGALSHSITRDAAEAGDEGFNDLIAEQTPGGVNEKAIEHLTKAGVYAKLEDTLGMIYATLEPQKATNRKAEFRPVLMSRWL
jgi:pyrroline-5-carboxylate reductase